MTRGLRLLQSAAAPPPEAVAAAVESDFVVILAALLCALICVVGLVAIARCAWLRRGTAGSSAAGAVSSPATANKGLKKKVVNSLPKFTYAEDGDRRKWSECAICLTEFGAGDEVRVLPQCGHGFHVACVDTWLASHSSCPSCRAPFAVVARCQKCGHFPAVASASAASESKAVGCDNAAVSAANANRNNVIITNGFSNYGFLP